MDMESLPEEVVKMIEDPSSWQDTEKIPIITSNDFNSLLKSRMNNKELSLEACNQFRKMLVTGGLILDFGKLVVIKPQWLADSFKAIISTKNIEDKGIITSDQIQKRLFNSLKLNISGNDLKNLLEIWENELSVCILHPKLKNTFIVPSLLDEEDSTKINDLWKTELHEQKCIGRIYEIPFLPPGIFEGIYVQMCRISSAIHFWRNGLLLNLNGGHILMQIFSKESKITIQTTRLFYFTYSYLINLF